MQQAKIFKKFIVFALTLSMVFSAIPVTSNAAAKPKLSKKTKTIYVGKSFNLTIKNKKSKAKTSWKTSNKRVAKITKKTSKKATIKGVRKGKATITCKVKVGKKTYTLKCKVNVKKKKAAATPTPTPTVKPTATPVPATVQTLSSTDVINGKLDLTGKTYDSLKISSNVGNAIIQINNCTINGTLTLETGLTGSITINNSTINNITVQGQIIKTSGGLVIGNGTKVTKLAVSDSIYLNQISGGTISTLEWTSKNAVDKILDLNGFKGDFLFNSTSTAKLTVNLTNCQINKATAATSTSKQKLEIIDSTASGTVNSSSVGTIELNAPVALTLKTKTTNITIGSGTTGAELQLEKEVGTITNAGTSSVISWNNKVDSVVDNGTKSTFNANNAYYTINSFSANGNEMTLTLAKNARMNQLTVAGTSCIISLGASAVITTANINGNSTIAKGSGIITTVNLNASNCAINLAGSKVILGSTAFSNTGNGYPLTAGSTVTVMTRNYTYKDLGIVTATYNAGNYELRLTSTSFPSLVSQVNLDKIRIGAYSITGTYTVSGNDIIIKISNYSDINKQVGFNSNGTGKVIMDAGAIEDITGNIINYSKEVSCTVSGSLNFSIFSPQGTFDCNSGQLIITSSGFATTGIRLNNISAISIAGIPLQGGISYSLSGNQLSLIVTNAASIRQAINGSNTALLRIGDNAFANGLVYNVASEGTLTVINPGAAIGAISFGAATTTASKAAISTVPVQVSFSATASQSLDYNTISRVTARQIPVTVMTSGTVVTITMNVTAAQAMQINGDSVTIPREYLKVGGIQAPSDGVITFSWP